MTCRLMVLRVRLVRVSLIISILPFVSGALVDFNHEVEPGVIILIYTGIQTTSSQVGTALVFALNLNPMPAMQTVLSTVPSRSKRKTNLGQLQLTPTIAPSSE